MAIYGCFSEVSFASLCRSCIVNLLTFLFLVNGLPNSAGAGSDPVIWGGVSLATIGDTLDDQLAVYPAAAMMMYCKSRAEGCPHGSLNDIARERLGFRQIGTLSISMDGVGIAQSSGDILSPVLAGEMVLEGYEGPTVGYSYTYMIFVNLMVLRFEGGKAEYVASFPFILRWLDFKPERQSREAQVAVLRAMYASDELGFNLFDELGKAADTGLKLRHDDSRLVAITDVVLSDEVGEVLEQTYSRAAWSQQIANFFEANIAVATGKPILPSRLGEDGRKTLNLVFDDATRQLAIPDPGWRIKINVERFVRDDVVSGTEKLACFMVATRFQVTDPFGDEVANIRLTRKQDACSELKAGMKREDRVYFPENLLSQLSQLAEWLGGKDDTSFLSRNVIDQPGADVTARSARNSMFGE